MEIPRRSLFLVLLLVAGCSSASQPTTYDSKRAEETLVLALDAWKQGRVGSLAKRVPPLRFEDEDCRSGLRLTEYRLEPREQPLRPFDDVRVVLVLRDRRQNRLEKTVAYQVSLEPKPAVLRND
jgi:hypothetical protein